MGAVIMKPLTDTFTLIVSCLCLPASVLFLSPNVCLAQQGAGGLSAPADLDWRPVQTHSRMEIIEFLQKQTKGNYEQIRTWEVTYAIRQREYASEEYMSKSLGHKFTGNAVKEFSSTMKVVIDVNAAAAFRSKQKPTLKFQSEDANEEIKVPDVKPVAWNSVVTAEHFVHFDPNSRVPEGLAVLPNDPKAFNKRVAFRDPAKEGDSQGLGELMDPRDFFGCSPIRKFWEDLAVYQALVRMEPDKKRIEELYTLEEAVKDGVTWYREKWKKTGFTIIWNPHYGYNAQSCICSRDPEGKNVLSSLEWKWKMVDNIYVPSYVKQRSGKGRDGKFHYEREVEMLECVLNRPLDPHQFNYKGLGLEDGDLVVDNTENVVNIMEGGKLVKLGVFGEKYEAPRPVKGSGSRKLLLVAVNVAVLVIFVGLVMYRLLRKRPKAA
jgi:hypothetical protein